MYLSPGEGEANRNYMLLSERVKNIHQISDRLYFPVLFNFREGKEWRLVPELFAFLFVITHITA